MGVVSRVRARVRIAGLNEIHDQWWGWFLGLGLGREGACILVKCDISSSMLEVVGEVWKGILLCKLYRMVKDLVGCGW